MYQPRKLELVQVSWDDAHHNTSYDGDPAGFKLQVAELTDVGYFIAADERVFVIASCIEPATGTARWYTTIPQVCVREVMPLRSELGTVNGAPTSESATYAGFRPFVAVPHE